jgi:hypothetical protein
MKDPSVIVCTTVFFLQIPSRPPAIQGYIRLGGLPNNPCTDPQDCSWFGPHDRLFTPEKSEDSIQYVPGPLSRFSQRRLVYTLAAFLESVPTPTLWLTSSDPFDANIHRIVSRLSPHHSPLCCVPLSPHCFTWSLRWDQVPVGKTTSTVIHHTSPASSGHLTSIMCVVNLETVVLTAMPN